MDQATVDMQNELAALHTLVQSLHMQNELAALHTLVQSLQHRISTLERRQYAEPVTPIPSSVPPPWTGPFIVTCDGATTVAAQA